MKAVLFDFDGVLTLDRTGTQSIARYICTKTGLDLEWFKHCYYPHNEDLLTGRTTHVKIWSQLCKEWNMEVPYSLLIDSFINTPIDEDMIHYAWELKKQYKLAMVTDNKADRMEKIIEFHGWDRLFDTISVSAVVGSGKDQTDIFQKTLDTLEVSAADCVFIDNTQANLTVPEQLGMKTILFDDKNRNINEFKKVMEDILS